METGKQAMLRANSNRLSGVRTSLGTTARRSGGILLGVNSTVLDVSIIVQGEFFLLNFISLTKTMILNGF